MSISIRKLNLYFKMLYEFLASYKGSSKAVFLSAEETVHCILKERKSFIRFGDGEFDIMEGKGIHYQKFNKRLARRLEKIVTEYTTKGNNSYLLGMPGLCLKPTGRFLLKSYVMLSSWAHSRYYFNKRFDKSVQYGDAFLFRKGIENTYKRLWTESKVNHFIFVHNDKKYADKFWETWGAEVSFIKVPKKNAFDNIDAIYKEIKSKIKEKNEMVLISAGPCGKVLAYRLSGEGIWVIDTGHCWDNPISV